AALQQLPQLSCHALPGHRAPPVKQWPLKLIDGVGGSADRSPDPARLTSYPYSTPDFVTFPLPHLRGHLARPDLARHHVTVTVLVGDLQVIARPKVRGAPRCIPRRGEPQLLALRGSQRERLSVLVHGDQLTARAMRYGELARLLDRRGRRRRRVRSPGRRRRDERNPDQ